MIKVVLLLLPVLAIVVPNKVPAVFPYLRSHLMSSWVKTPHLCITVETFRFISIVKRFLIRLVIKMWLLLLATPVAAKQLKFLSTLWRKLMKTSPPVVLFASFPDVFQFWQLKIVLQLNAVGF